MGIVGEGEHEPHGNAFHPRTPEPVHRPIHRVFTHGFQHRAIAVHALGDGMNPLPGNQRVGRRLLGVVQVRAHTPPHVEHVPEPGRGEQRRARPVARQQGVGGDGAAVNDPFGTLQQLAEGEAQILGHEREAGHERARAILRIGQSLQDAAVAAAGDHEVDEGAADVYADHISRSGTTHNYMNLLCFKRSHRQWIVSVPTIAVSIP